MTQSDLTSSNHQENWERFCDLLWFDDQLGFWLDISRMSIKKEDFDIYETGFKNCFNAIQDLEGGSIANRDENRQVGHYWLRNPNLVQNEKIKNNIIDQIQSIKSFGNKVLQGQITNDNNESFTDILWIGIGGSGLGPLLIVEALQETNKGLNFHFLDNIDSEGISRSIRNLENKISRTLIVVVSKSGGTPEPKLCMEQIRHFIENKNLKWNSHAVAITMQSSALDKLASNENWLARFDLPEWVGGRTSITGSVGLLPITLVGANITDFLKGASIMDTLTRNTNIKNNPAALLALSWLKAGNKKGLRDMVVLPYKDRLEVFSRYLQQLVMESLGKKENRSGFIVNQGIAVYGNKGSTDQHAYVQQLRDGIDNFFVTFIEVLKDSGDIPALNGKNPGDYLSGFLQGTRSALSQGNRQSLTITIREFNEASLGALIALFERAVSFYAELIDINAYHQPGVEAGKKAASEILKLQNDIETTLNNNKSLSINEINNLIPGSNLESIFWILRHLSHNKDKFSFTGDWNKPSSLRFNLE
tara:strand:- start:6068 stop:7666 length:1599 start_codon:yes stop_codon:yes gene_type:complete